MLLMDSIRSMVNIRPRETENTAKHEEKIPRDGKRADKERERARVSFISFILFIPVNNGCGNRMERMRLREGTQ